MLFLLWASARTAIRQRWYDIFLPTHIMSAILVILASNLHDYNTLMFAWPGLAEMLVDRLTRLLSCQDKVEISQVKGFASALPNPLGAQSISELKVVKLTIDQPKSWTSLAPGKHVYLQDASINRQWHPVTISSIDYHHKQVSFHIKALGDWTDDFVSKYSKYDPGQKENIYLTMEGLYGPDLSSTFKPPTTSCIFVAGGVGVTGLSEAIQACAERGVPFAAVWVVRTRAEAEALGAELLWNTRLLRSVNRNQWSFTNGAAFRVFVTAEECTNPDAPEGSHDSFAQDGNASDGHVHGSKTSGSMQEVITPARTKLSEFTVSVAVLFSMALSFIMARQLCCYRPHPNMDHAKACGLAFDSKSCRSCSMYDIMHQDEVPNELPCCTVACYLCFRGLTVLSVLFSAPLLAISMLWILRQYWPVSETHCCSLLARRTGRNHYHSAIQEIITIQEENGSISWAPVNLSGIESGELALTYQSPMSSELVSVDYRRPDIGLVLQSLWEAPENETLTNCVMSVIVCGPQRLVDGVREEVKRQQSQDFANQYKLIVM